MEPEPIESELRRGLRWLKTATVFCYIALVMLFGLGWHDAVQKRQALAEITRSTNHALCTFRADLEQRVSASTDFLVKHPHGIPGIPVATIKQSIDSEQRTVDALKQLNCSPTTTP